MVVMKKVNNNVAVCMDGSGRELIAFGKGIGFPTMPYELTDLSRIDRTFYDVDSQYLPLLSDIPGDVIELTAKMMDEIQDKLPYELNPNIVLTLADHIAFAIERSKKGIYVQMPSVYEMEQTYPLEIRIGRRFCSAVQRCFHVRLPKDEVQGIAMHFINAKNGESHGGTLPAEDFNQKYDEMLEQTTEIVEWEMGIHVVRDSFNYARFATHLQYLLRRLFTEQYLDTDNAQMYDSIRSEYPEVAACVDKIDESYQRNWSVVLTDEEKLYLIMHINRVCAKEASQK